ncbi:MAG: hypothetical protein JRJ12_13565 [Deltaproteobacteria bacterium]|nr:hypothetical protein [Deltaproteobacteria bacterium]MBW2072645.1 hypothetical protein [Deltaproteobacteria bacterium]
MSLNSDHWQPSGAATLVGSLPHRDRQRALDLVYEEISEVPVWPQLSAYPMEQMIEQFSEGLPGLVTREGRTFFHTSDSTFEQSVLEFYEEYLAVTAGELPLAESRFRLGQEAARTMTLFLEQLPSRNLPMKAVKGQTVGPFTLLATLRTEADRLALYESQLRDVVVKTLALKAQWQTEMLKQFDLPPIVFIDEPALAGFGSSAFISVSAEEVIQLIHEVVQHIHQAGGLAGIHVCANTDWSLFFSGSLDVINFDAYTYFDRFSLYRSELSQFIKKGGFIAWGIVPTMEAEDIERESEGSLAIKWQEQIAGLISDELDLATLFRHSLITPSCGCGSLNEARAERVVRLTRKVSDKLRKELL